MSDIVFMDTETTGLSLDDDIWEFAGVRRKPDGSESELHLFLRHDPAKCAALPESFAADHRARFPVSDDEFWHPDVVTRAEAAQLISAFLTGRPHIVGAVPNFDTERLQRLLGAAPWHYHLIDVENLVVGWAAAQKMPLNPPWDSDFLSGLMGVTAPIHERHTAMGDVRWAMRIYDAVMAGPVRK